VHSLRSQLKKLIREKRYNWVVEGDDVVVATSAGSRRQRVRISRVGGHYAFATVILGAALVKRSKKRWRELAIHAWTRNAETDLVNFTFDRSDRLIGEIRHPADHLDPEELELYVKLLAAESDRFEYVLTGDDRH